MIDEVIKQIKDKIAELNATYMKYHNWEQGTKIMINSFYGGLANPYMYFFDPSLAECITKQGKNAILYAESNINDYFLNHWYEDKETHRKIGVKVTKPVVSGVTVYIDTDSVDKSTVINISHDGKQESVTIEKLYNACIKFGSAGDTLAGHESVNCSFSVLNYNNGDLYYAPVKRVIRHKVNKKKWVLMTKTGNSVIVTNDHSLVVFRKGKHVECTAENVRLTDKILILDLFGYGFDDVAYVKCIGNFDDEYVYDIEIDDDTHTFIANNILVHNSVYSQLDEVISTTDWNVSPGTTNWKVTLKTENGSQYETRFCGSRTIDEVKSFFETEYPSHSDLKIEPVNAEAKDFALRLDEVFLADYFKSIFETYAKRINADNYLNFELETFSDAGIWLAKKKYVQNLRWTDSMPRHDILERFSKIKSRGVELIQPSSPAFARKKLTYLVRWIFEHDNFSLKDFVAELKKIKDEFMLANPDDISWNKKATEYEKWIVDDKKELIMKKGTPITTKGIAYYNYKLNKNQKYKSRYSTLNPGNKCKYYYCKDKLCEMFAYEPGMFPIEFAPEIDRNVMFEKTILTPINRIVEAIGFAPVEPDLIVLNTTKLF